MMMKILAVLLVMLAGVSQPMTAQDKPANGASGKTDSQKEAANSKNAQSKDSAQKGTSASATDAAKDTVEKPEIHEFVIANFKTESGVTLPQARVVYGTYGHLNAARDNVVLLPSHYMADCHGYEWLIGPDCALDTSKLFLVATELFGNGHSSSPSNTPEPFHGHAFRLRRSATMWKQCISC